MATKAGICVVCFEQTADYVYSCGHRCICAVCQQRVPRCPLCRTGRRPFRVFDVGDDHDARNVPLVLLVPLPEGEESENGEELSDEELSDEVADYYQNHPYDEPLIGISAQLAEIRRGLVAQCSIRYRKGKKSNMTKYRTGVGKRQLPNDDLARLRIGHRP